MNIPKVLIEILIFLWKTVKIVGAFICAIFIIDTIQLAVTGQLSSNIGAGIFLLINCFIIYEVLRTEFKFW